MGPFLLVCCLPKLASPTCTRPQPLLYYLMPTSLLLVTGLVSKPTHEGQETAAGYDLAASCRPRLLHLYDEPCCSYGQPALSVSISPSSTLLLSTQRCDCRFSLCHRGSILQSSALAGQFSGSFASIPASWAAVRLQTPITVPQPGSWAWSRGKPMLLPCLSRCQSVKRAPTQVQQRRLLMFAHDQDWGLPHVLASSHQ